MPFWICCYIVRQEPKIKLCGKQMFMTKSRLLTSTVWCDNVDLLYLKLWWNLGWFLFENKTRKVPQWSYYLPKPYVVIMFKPSTYACLWPIEFWQIVVTLGRIFSCFHDRGHVHPHIHANSYTGSYAKHAIHPPKNKYSKVQEITLLVILQKERGVIEKRVYAQEA
jgi:hypothetical protein